MTTLFALLGNTTMKVAAGSGPATTLPFDGAREALASVIHRQGCTNIAAASVNPDAEEILAGVATSLTLPAPLYAGRDFSTEMEFDVENPQGVGVDRVLNLKAAFARTGRPSAVVDFGTAVSISVCDAEGRFKGGAILPGVSLSLRALADGTAFLPRLEVAMPESALGRSTRDAMLAGACFGAVGAVKELLVRIADETGVEPAVLVTGGDAKLLAPLMPGAWSVAEELTMEGLRLVYGETR